MHRIFVVAAIVSALLMAVTALLFIISVCDLDPRDHHLSITSRCHVTVEHGDIVFFNNADYGPYRGSVVQLSGDDGPAYPPIERSAFGDICGLYYRHLRWLDSGDVLWTLAVSLAYPLVSFAILPAIWLWFQWHQGGRPPTTCSLGCNNGR
jgi:hypothetical protein